MNILPEAINFLEKSLSIFKTALPEDHPYQRMALERTSVLYRSAATHYALLADKATALSLLQKAVGLGFDDIEWLTTNDTLALLREDSSFIALLEEVKTKKQEQSEPEIVQVIPSEPAPTGPSSDTTLQAPVVVEAQEQPASGQADKEATLSRSWGVFQIVQETSLRQQPGSAYKVLKRLAVGAEVALLEKTDKYWWFVSYKGQNGYVKAHLLEPVQ